MMVATQELCEQLCELSGWGIEESALRQQWSRNGIGEWFVDGAYPHVFKGQIPAYDLGYLLRKLPPPSNLDADVIYEALDCGQPDYLFLGFLESVDAWTCQYQIDETPLDAMMAEASTPEDAAAKLATELFKQGVLQPEAV